MIGFGNPMCPNLGTYLIEDEGMNSKTNNGF